VTVAVLPASFDPITCGHVDIIRRAARLFDRLVVAVYDNPKKSVLFQLDERVAMITESIGRLPGVEVMPYGGLTVHFARDIGADVLVRGLRALQDFEYEFQLASLNRQMMPELEVICMFASIEFEFLSSSIIKEIAENGGDVSTMVPEPVARRLALRFLPEPRVPSGR
jgi:pantetheine-phosphate adenylyltransferase